MFNHENLRSVNFFLEWIAREATISPNYIMADGAPQITLAIENVFPNSVRLMCSFHTKKNIRSHLGEIRSVDQSIAGRVVRANYFLNIGSVCL